MKKLVVLAILLTIPLSSWAQGERAGKWDFGVQTQYMGSESVDASTGSSLAIDSKLGFGLVFGYNISNKLAVNFDMSWSRPDYTATLVREDGGPDETLQHSLDMFTGQLKGAYYFMEGKFSPFVEAGLGWTYIDSNIASSPPITGCWWDPWWGYVCSNFYDTYSDSNFSYGGGVGVRWELGYNTYVRASYSLLRLDLGSSAGTPEFEFGRLEFGWRY